MNKLLLINCCAEDDFSKISNYLLEKHQEEVFEGMKQRAAAVSAKEIAALLPNSSSLTLPADTKVYYAQESLITGNPYAALEAIKGKMPRPTVTEEAPVWNELEVVMITPEEAYRLNCEKNKTEQKKMIFINWKEQSQVLEVPMNKRLSEAVNESGISLEKVKAVLLGGIRGRFYRTEDLTDLVVQEDALYDSLTLYPEEACMVEEMRKLAKLIQTTSCGKCVLCREGSLQYRTVIEDVTAGKAKMPDIDMMKEISELIKIGAYCTFGQSMPTLITSGLTLFANEFEAHIKKKNCPAGVCDAFASYCILPKQCTGCEDCLDACPEDAIEGKAGYIHMIDEDLCTKCGKCLPACEEGAIIKVVGTKPKVPQKLTKVGKF